MVREVLPSNDLIKIAPASGSHVVPVSAGEQVSGVDFTDAMISTATLDSPPVITSMPPKTVILGQTLLYHVTVDDQEPGAILQYDLPEHPFGMTLDLSNPNDPVIRYQVPDHYGAPRDVCRVLLRVTDLKTGAIAIQPFTVTYIAPAPVVSGLAASSSVVDLSWPGIPFLPDVSQGDAKGNQPNQTTYLVFKSTTPWTTFPDYTDPSQIPATLDVVPAQEPHSNQLYFRDFNLLPNTQYYYYVLARVEVPSDPANPNGGFHDIYSPFAVCTVTTFSANNVLAVPGGIQATPQGDNSIDVEWLPNADTVARSYNVYRGTTDDPAAATLIAGGITDPFYSDRNLPNGVPYYYFVAAVDGNGHPSARSHGVPAQTNPNTPTLAPLASGSSVIATATPDSGFITSTQLNVGNASSPDGTTPTSYHWSVSGPPGVTQDQTFYDPNLQSVVARFGKPGIYVFHVHAVNAYGYSDSADVTVTVGQKFSIVITPGSATLLVGQSQDFPPGWPTNLAASCRRPTHGPSTECRLSPT